MKKLLLLLLCVPLIGFGQEYFWENNLSNQDFFDENNWIDTVTGINAPPFSIEPNQDINLDLNLTCNSYANLPIRFGSGSINILNGTLFAHSIISGIVTMSSLGSLVVTDSIPFVNNIQINLLSPLNSIKLTSVSPKYINNNYLSLISVSQMPANFPNNIRLDNYYTRGTVIRPNDSITSPLSIFSQDSLDGSSSDIIINQIFNGSLIPNNMNNNIHSFLLRRGYMVTMAVNEDGTGKSKVFIAAEKDLVVYSLPDILDNGISFIRVIPWNWISKKGLCGDYEQYLMLTDSLDSWWYYDWGNSDSSHLNKEYTPMSWGAGGANDQSDINKYKSIDKATHVMGFNEADNCNGQSGQWNNLCIPDTAVILYRNLMKTGLRLVSPGCREEAWNDWLDTFNILAVQQNTRIDVIAVHWYDWGGNPANTPNANPQGIFNRFRNYLNNVHNLYNLPIWITEFNGNVNRTASVNLEFMKLALPYLDSISYIERYAWFSWNSSCTFLDSSGNLTPTGAYYENHQSNPSIYDAVWGGRNNLDSTDNGIVYNSECVNVTCIYGCTDATSCNYDVNATCDDGSCELPDGCMDPVACNYDSTASCDDGSCLYLESTILQSGDSLFVITNPVGLSANWYNIQNQDTVSRIWLMEENSETYMPTFDCSYFIIVEDDNGCIDTSSTYYFGANATKIVSFVTSPNPTSGLINVKFKNSKNQFVYLHLMNGNGVKLDEFITIENNLTIDLSRYPSGIYYLYFNSEDAVQGCRLEEVQKLSTKIILNK